MTYREANRIIFKDSFRIAPLPTKEMIDEAYKAFGFHGIGDSICDSCEQNPVNYGTCEMYHMVADKVGFSCNFYRHCKEKKDDEH